MKRHDVHEIFCKRKIYRAQLLLPLSLCTLLLALFFFQFPSGKLFLRLRFFAGLAHRYNLFLGTIETMGNGGFKFRVHLGRQGKLCASSIWTKIPMNQNVVLPIRLFHHLLIVFLQFHQGFLVSHFDTVIHVALVLLPFSCFGELMCHCCGSLRLVLLLLFLEFLSSAALSSPPYLP